MCVGSGGDWRPCASSASDYDALDDSVSTYDEIADFDVDVERPGLTDWAIAKAGIAPPTAGRRAGTGLRAGGDADEAVVFRLRGDGASTPSSVATSKS